MELWLDSQISEHKWTLEFQLRSATGQEPLIQQQRDAVGDETFEKGYLEEARQSIEHLFQPETIFKPGQLMERLEAQIGKPRREWGRVCFANFGIRCSRALPFAKKQ